MNRLAIFALSGCALATAPISGAPSQPPAPVWPAISPEAWKLQDDPGKDGKGAVILAKDVHLSSHHVGYSYRIRIFSERGVAAAEFKSFPPWAYGLQGRVAYPDGSEVAFNSQQDFHARTPLTVGSHEFRTTVLVPPGLTDDCIVDLRWSEAKPWAAWRNQGEGSETWELAEAFPVTTLTLEIARNAGFDWQYHPGRNSRGQRTDTVSSVIYTLQEVAASEVVPFASRSAMETPRMKAYVMDEVLHKAAQAGPEAFWKAAAKRLRNLLEDRLVLGGAYNSLSEAWRKGLPAAPQALATELSLRLQERIREQGGDTLEERFETARAAKDKPANPRDLEAAALSRVTPRGGLLFLLYQLLRDAGLKPKVVLAMNRDNGAFNPRELNLNQFSDLILGVEQPGLATLWLDPRQHFATPGLLAAAFQGTRALELDTAAWTHQEIQLPVQGPASNRSQETYRIELLADHDRVSYSAAFTGLEDAGRRRPLRRFDAVERQQVLKELLEERCPEAVLDQAEPGDAQDLRQPLAWQALARLERAAGRYRVVAPFPFSAPLLPLPGALPLVRSQTISLPYLAEQACETRFTIPKGYRWLGRPVLDRSNAFGSVRLMVEPAEAGPGVELTATLAVSLKLPGAPAHRWDAFTEFLGWLREAQEARLVLEVVR